MTKSNWIKTEHYLPMTGLNVLCQWEKRNGSDKEIYLEIMYKNKNNEWISKFGMCNGMVTHWQYLPEIAS